MSQARVNKKDKRLDSASASAFGRSFGKIMAQCDFIDEHWQPMQIGPLRSLSLHPATHAIHYASACFEGLKAFRHADGGLHIFRLEKHIVRFRSSARGLHLPVPEIETLIQMITETVRENADMVPQPPGALYVRPSLFGTDANLGAVTQPSVNAKLMVLVSPVGGYFSAGKGELCLHLLDDCRRAVPGIAAIKASANYALALAPIMRARKEYGADQVLFCPDGDVQETGTSNFFLIDDKYLLTKPVDDSFLAGVKRDSILRLASDLGYDVAERNYSPATLIDWLKYGEAALCGTAAAITPVGAVIYKDSRYVVNEGRPQGNVDRLRQALLDIQFGRSADRNVWLSADISMGDEPRSLSLPE